MSKPRIGYLLFDLPGDHEIEASLATECKVIEAIIHNMDLKSRVKRVCVASTEKLKQYPRYKYGVQFVHLACHGGPDGIGLLGGSMSWSDVAIQIERHLTPLLTGQQRVMVFSCCYSAVGFRATETVFAKHFTGAYYFKEDKIPFYKALTVWSMFYFKKELTKPHGAIAKSINTFMGDATLVFKSYK